VWIAASAGRGAVAGILLSFVDNFTECRKGKISCVSYDKRMTSILSIATSGMTAATRRLEVSARNVANVSRNSPSHVRSYDPNAPYADSRGMVASPNVDLADEVVQQMVAQYTFAANAKVVNVYAQMMKSLLDIKT